ncbi:MAG TPA: membrane protein insertion efficiency factor YidD [Vicinamibacteria bacterium]|nr:membrane protein insertion efficiency factor YidD [Vicinamibacteria bacterium]
MSSEPACAASRPVSPLARALVLAIEGYRLMLSPLIGGLCRFEPSCSRYAQQALLRHGARRGLWLAARRLLRCHPFSAPGHDPVP